MNLFYTFFIGCLSLSESKYNLRFERELKANPQTIQEIELDKYLGYWYQVYGAPTNVIFQGYGKCITADYGLLDDGNISVLNSQLNKNSFWMNFPLIREIVYGRR